ncbi:MAG TPA: peptide deformylase [Pirellulales bacterium]|nr:peptide deformylase [Pirellulales bacterium]
MSDLKIIQYPHPTLRHVSKPLKRVDVELRSIIARMFELMYEAKGVGLAANQVDLPYRFFISNLQSDPAKGEQMVFINPVLSRHKGSAEAEEGCLSLPGLYADVKRSEHVMIDAFNLAGEAVHLEADGLLARVVQHETDHLNGKLFVDRLGTAAQLELRDALREFEIQFTSQQEHGEMPDEAALKLRLQELERLRT